MKNAWLILGIGLVLAGLASLLYFAAAVLGWPVPDRLQVGLGFVVFGVLATALGAFMALRPQPAPRVEQARSEERVEPFIGPAVEAGSEAVPGFRRMGVRRGA